MANFQKVYLRIVGRVGDTSADPDKLPDRVMATGQIFLKPNIKDGWAEQTQGPDGIDELMLPAPITCTVEDGMMTYNGDPFVWLVVGDENWNWSISFPQIRIAGAVRKIDPFNFDLTPATEEQIEDENYQGVNLALLQDFTDPNTGNKAVRGPRGYSIDDVTLIGADQLAFSLDDPLDTTVSIVTVPAITAANTARDAAIAAQGAAETAQGLSEGARDASISAKTAAESARDIAQGYAEDFNVVAGTTTTLPPGSSATVTVDDSNAPTFEVNIGVPQGIEGPQGPPAPDAATGQKGLVALDGDFDPTSTADAPRIGSKKITGAKIADDTITAAQIANDAITAAELADNAVDTNAIASKAVTAAKIADDTITAAQIAADAITASELADNAVDTNAIQNSAVTSAKIADGTIVNADINNTAAIAASKTLVPASFFFVSHGATRAVGTGDLASGVPIMEPLIIDEVIFWFDTADASGSTSVKLQYQRAGTTADIVGATKTVASTDQTNVSGTDTARRTGALTDATRSLQAGDRLLMNITAVGTTPGKVMGAWIKARWL